MIQYIAAAVLLATPVTADTSAFGCVFPATESAVPSIEGHDGTFFRVLSDIRMYHPMADPIIARMSALSAALAQGGTTLIYVAIPTKAEAMPDQLPDLAKDYQYNSKTAVLVYQDIITRLSAQGIIAPDILAALGQTDAKSPPFFKTDFHWTAEGALLAANVIAAQIRAEPDYVDLPKSKYVTTAGPMTAAFSTLRRSLQRSCQTELPRVEAQVEVTEKTIDPAAEADIFADALAPQIVLVGTSFSDAPLANFAGYLAQSSGLDVLNYAVTGGNQYGAITSYLISRDFAKARPRFLIWENPIYNNLAQFGPDPMEELIAAASDRCTTALPVQQTDPNTLTADLTGLNLQPSDTILADLGDEGGRRADFRLQTVSGIARSASIQRNDRMRASGRFFQSLGTLWHPDLKLLSVTFDQPVSADTKLSLCIFAKEPL
jgi:alginate biosynthesis protein AlgX